MRERIYDDAEASASGESSGPPKTDDKSFKPPEADEVPNLVARYQRCALRIWELFSSDPLPHDDPAQFWIERLESILERKLLSSVSEPFYSLSHCHCGIKYSGSFKVCPKCNEAPHVFTPHDAEIARLEFEVVQAAVRFRQAETSTWVESEVGSNDSAIRAKSEGAAAYLSFVNAVDALNVARKQLETQVLYQEKLCGVVGVPESGRKVCELPLGHEDYHQQGSARWLGYQEKKP